MHSAETVTMVCFIVFSLVPTWAMVVHLIRECQ
jgi:hypothetical protein